MLCALYIPSFWIWIYILGLKNLYGSLPPLPSQVTLNLSCCQFSNRHNIIWCSRKQAITIGTISTAKNVSRRHFRPTRFVIPMSSTCFVQSQTGPPPWSSLVEGEEGLYLPNCQTNLVIALCALPLLFCKFINTTAYHLGRYKLLSPIGCRAPRLSHTVILSPTAIVLWRAVVVAQLA